MRLTYWPIEHADPMPVPDAPSSFDSKADTFLAALPATNIAELFRKEQRTIARVPPARSCEYCKRPMHLLRGFEQSQCPGCGAPAK